MRTEVNINSDILTWAIARAGYDLQDFLLKNPRVEKWLEKINTPTVKQLEDLANKLHLPFGYLFLPVPPNETIPFPFFRTGAGVTHKVNLNIYDTILLLQRRQDWLTDYLIENEEPPLPFVGKYDNSFAYKIIVEDIRKTLGIEENWAQEFQNFEQTLNFLTKKIEATGIIVNFNGVVGNNTHRPIPVAECRGFVLVNNMAPFLFINAADAKAAQLFTIVHELAHVWLGESAGFDNEKLLPANDPIERLCDQIAAEFLVPKDSFNLAWKKEQDFRSLGKIYKVSPIVIARRALDLNKITKEHFFDFYNSYMEEIKRKKERQGPGGDFYATSKKRISLSFATYVNQAVKQNRLLYRDAYKMTGLKGKTYDNFVTQHLY